MVNLWMPGATRQKVSRNNGKMAGGKPRVTWHCTVNDPNKTSAAEAAAYIRTHYPVHLVWNPVSGDIIQMIPANLGGLGLERNTSEPTNSKGKYNIQIEVVAFADKPFTDYECKGLDLIMDWLRSLGIPDVFPGGPPLAYGENGAPAYGRGNGDRSVEAWQEAGHFTHSQVPANEHGDPGKINISKLFAAGTKKPDPVISKTYVVQDGDTLWGIAQKFSVSVDDLEKWNKLNTTVINPGDKLYISEPLPVIKPKPTPVPEGSYRVRDGDTLWDIAKKFDVSVDQLMNWNDLKSTVINPGDVLVVVKVKPTIHLANVKPGERNDDVKKLQRTLIARGWHVPSGVTGYFGSETRAAVKKFQEHQGWSGSDADGVPGKVTLQRLGFIVV